MSLKIRLSRAGSKKRPYYHIVLADSRSPRDGKYIERLGSYNPMLPKDSSDRTNINEERIKHWLSMGAKPTDRVARFLGKANIIETPKFREQPKKSRPKQKTLDRIAEQEEKAQAAAEAQATAETDNQPEDKSVTDDADTDSKIDSETISSDNEEKSSEEDNSENEKTTKPSDDASDSEANSEKG